MPLLILIRRAACAALAGSAAVLLALACEPSSDTSAPLTPGDAGRPSARAASADGGGGSDSLVLDFLLADSDTEVERARFVAAKTTRADVKAYAALMIADHGAMADRLRALAGQKGIAPSTSPSGQDVRSDADDIRAKLDGLKGTSFDRNYLEEEIIAHLKSMAAIDRSVAPTASDPDVVRAVSDARDSAVTHREHAQDALRDVNADAGPPAPESSSSSNVTSWSDGGTPP